MHTTAHPLSVATGLVVVIALFLAMLLAMPLSTHGFAVACGDESSFGDPCCKYAVYLIDVIDVGIVSKGPSFFGSNCTGGCNMCGERDPSRFEDAVALQAGVVSATMFLDTYSCWGGELMFNEYEWHSRMQAPTRATWIQQWQNISCLRAFWTPSTNWTCSRRECTVPPYPFNTSKCEHSGVTADELVVTDVTVHPPPTVAPTAVPTAAPTAAPTATPTPRSTASPTAAPPERASVGIARGDASVWGVVGGAAAAGAVVGSVLTWAVMRRPRGSGSISSEGHEGGDGAGGASSSVTLPSVAMRAV